MRKVNQYKRIYYKELGVLTATLFISFLVVASTSSQDQVYVRPQATSTQVINTPPQTSLLVEAQIKQHFPRSHVVMLAIAKAESNLDNTAKGYNCYYNKQNTIVYTERVKGSHSQACLPTHRKYAYSVDCFILQRNYKGKECPKNVTLTQHLEEVAALSKVQGLSAWSAYNNQSYKKYLATNDTNN